MREILVIGIGAGDPEHVTVGAVRALNEVDVFFVVEKPGERDELVALRREICRRYIEDQSYRVVSVPDPQRDRSDPAYREAVEDWRRRRTDVWERVIREELGEDERGAFLVWGDPSLYDSTLAIIDAILDRGAVAFEYRVIPGITSVQALTAQHRIALNRVGGAVQIMPGRLLRDGWPDGVDDLVVMLDADAAFRAVAAEDAEIYWGAYVGCEDELLVSGPLTAEVMDEIERVRAAARERMGWIMDVYLLRRRPPAG